VLVLNNYQRGKQGGLILFKPFQGFSELPIVLEVAKISEQYNRVIYGRLLINGLGQVRLE